MLQLEKWSHYQHLSLSGGQERPIHCCRIIDVRGTRYHVLSRIQDAGLDFTGRTNFVAHHLVFTPEEVREFPSPAVILRDWTGWAKSWSQEPLILDTEDWSSLKALHKIGLLPAARWQQLTGDSANGYGLLDYRSGIVFCVDGVSGEEVLGLIGESLELLELRDPSHDFRATRWQYTFTTSLQEQDTTADFRWRCFHSDNPASARFTGLDRRSLIEIRPIQVTEAEALLARLGRQPPRFIEQPKKTQCFAAETANFKAVAEGVPIPTYQWFSVDRNNNRIEIPGAIESELLIPSAPLGVSRYVVRIRNSAGEETSEVAQLSSERRPVAPAQPGHERPVQVVQDPIAPRGLAGDRGIEESNRIQRSVPTRTADEIARNRSRIESQVQDRKYLTWSNFLKLIILVCIALMFSLWIENQRSSIELSIAQATEGDFTNFTEVRKEGKEFKVKELKNIRFVVGFKPVKSLSGCVFQWYHEATLLTNNSDTLMITNVLGASGGNYRALIIKQSKTNEIIKDSKTNIFIEYSKTNEVKAKLNIEKEAAPVAPPAPPAKPPSTVSLDTPTDSLGTAKSGEDHTTKIQGWEQTTTGDAIKGYTSQSTEPQKWIISDYKAAGIEKDEWIFISKTGKIEESTTNSFYLQFEHKDLNESEVGLIFRKGANFRFFGFKGTNFVCYDGNKITGKWPVEIQPSSTNLILLFTVELMKDDNNVRIKWWWTHLKQWGSRLEPLDYGKQSWQIGYAFATGKSPKETKAPTVYFIPDL